MWFLIEEPEEWKYPMGINTKTSIWALRAGETYTVGRASSNNIFPADDKSVSNAHATIRVIKSQKTETADARPDVMLEDLMSSHGTHINDASWTSLRKSDESKKGATRRGMVKPTVLKHNDRIKFGCLKFVFRLLWLDFEVTKSMLTDLKELKIWLRALGAELQPSWTETTTHLVMSNIKLSSKVLYCLACGIPIVTPHFFRDVISSIKTKQRLPDPDNYIPEVSSSESESLLRKPDICLKVNMERKKVFEGKTFVFLGESLKREAGLACELAGAVVKTWDPTTVKKESLNSGDVVVVQPKKGKTQDIEQGFASLLAYLESIGRTCVRVDRIYLAIVYCDFKFCFNERSELNILPAGGSYQKSYEKVLATETQNIPQDTGTSGHSEVSISSQQTSNPPESDVSMTTRSSQANCSLRRGQTQVVSAPVISNKQKELDVLKTRSSSSAKVSEVSEQEEPHRTTTYSQAEGPSADVVSPQNSAEMENYLVSSQQQDKKRPLSPGEDHEPASKRSARRPQESPSQEIIVEDKPKSKPLASSTQVIQNKSQNVTRSQRISRETEDDIFGFDELEKEEEKPCEPEKEETPTMSGMKRKFGMEDEDEDDIFGFGEAEEFVKRSKRTAEDTGAIKATSQKKASSSPEKTSDKENQPSKEQNPSMNNSIETKFNTGQTLASFNTTAGFLSKSCGKIKEEDGEMSKLSDDLCTILVVKLFRDTQSKPRDDKSLISDCSNDTKMSSVSTQGGKCFRKQRIYRSADKINVGVHQEPDGDQSIANWFQQNPDITNNIQEEERIQKDADDFWAFAESQTQQSAKTRRAR